MAVEKSMKFLIVQANEKVDKTHDLEKLRKKLSSIKQPLLEKQKIDMLPNSQQVIRYRYGEGSRISNLDVYANYVNVLDLVNSLTQGFERKIVFNNTIFTLGKLPWSK